MSSINSRRINYLYKELHKEVSKNNYDLKYDEKKEEHTHTIDALQTLENNKSLDEEVNIIIASFKYNDENIEKAFIIKINNMLFNKNNPYTTDLYINNAKEVKTYTPQYHHNLQSYNINTTLTKIIANKLINIANYSINNLYVIDENKPFEVIVYNILSHNIGELIRLRYEMFKIIKDNKRKRFNERLIFEYKILKEPLEKYNRILTLQEYINILK